MTLTHWMNAKALVPAPAAHVDGRLALAFGRCVRTCVRVRGCIENSNLDMGVPCVCVCVCVSACCVCVCAQWCIKAKVTRKGLMRSFGAGGAANKVFDVDLADAAVRQSSAYSIA